MKIAIYLLIFILSIWVTAKVSYWIGWTKREIQLQDAPHFEAFNGSPREYYSIYALRQCLINTKELEARE